MSIVIGTLDEIIEELRTEHQCRHCHEWFSEMDSMGTQRCRRHVGVLQTVNTVYGGQLNTYSCCGKSPFGWHPAYGGEEMKLGCVQCDHTADFGVPSDITMPAERAEVLFGRRLFGRYVIYDHRMNAVTINRRQRDVCW